MGPCCQHEDQHHMSLSSNMEDSKRRISIFCKPQVQDHHYIKDLAQNLLADQPPLAFYYKRVELQHVKTLHLDVLDRSGNMEVATYEGQTKLLAGGKEVPHGKG
jgi:hypothetical protein